MTATEIMTDTEILKIDGVSAGYGVGVRTPLILRDVSLSLNEGRTLGVVGESGSGKSTLARIIVGQLAARTGRVVVAGHDRDTANRRDARALQRTVQLIPQDPFASLDPRMTIGRTLAEALHPGRSARPDDRERIAALLETVALDADAARRLPHEFSGGQRQRVVIARALAVEPRVIVADEVTSALDASVQAEILNLLLRLQREQQLSMVFITHNLSIARYMCDELAVLYLGRIVEHGGTDILDHPSHPYTRLLRDSVPDGTPLGSRGAVAGGIVADGDRPVRSSTEPYGSLIVADGDRPVRSSTEPYGSLIVAEPGDPARPPAGCSFHPRCPIGPLVVGERTACLDRVPVLETTREGTRAACHFPIPQASTGTPSTKESIR